jgi:RteC protein
MRQLITNYIENLEKDLEANEGEENRLRRIAVALKMTEDTLRDILADVHFQLEYVFEKDFQIKCNKYWLPPLLARLLLLKKSYLLENRKLYSTGEQSKLYCEQELEKVQHFFESYKSFCLYYYSDQWEDDWQLFTDENQEIYPAIKEYLLSWPINPGCLLVSCLLMYEQYGRILREELGGGVTASSLTTGAKITVNATKTEMVEFILGLHASEFIQVDGASATQAFLIEGVRQLFGLELKNWPQLGQNIRARKTGGRTVFDRFNKELSDRNDRLNSN